jgi:thiol-disulfide isomerase/thioredoxin
VRMKALIIGLTLLLVLAGAGYDLYLSHPPVVQGDDGAMVLDPAAWEIAPDFAFEDKNGRKRRLRDFSGKPVIISFWATWCLPCKAEFPGLIRFVNSYKGRVEMIAVASDNDKAAVDKFLATMPEATRAILNKSFIHLALDKDRSITRDIFLTELYPETIFLDSHQRMGKKVIGVADWDRLDLQGFERLWFK